MKTEDIFIQRLKMLIAQQGKTVKSVAETLGISPSTFHGRLNIAQKFSPYDLNRIAYHLNVSLDFLFGRTDDPSREHLSLPPKNKTILRERLNSVNNTAYYTHADLAEEVGVSRKNFCNYLCGIRPPLHVLAGLANMFSVSVDYFTGAEKIKVKKRRPSEVVDPFEQMLIQVAEIYHKKRKEGCTHETFHGQVG